MQQFAYLPSNTVPGPVVGLEAASSSSSSLMVSWSPPELGGVVQFYRVSVSTVSENIRTEPTSQLFMDVNNLGKFTQYHIHVLSI